VGRLAGKVAVVTGASAGLGAEIARLYAEEGAAVALADIREDEGREVAESIRLMGGQAAFFRTDVSRESDVVHLIAQAEAEFGALDVMTSNAGVLGPAANRPLVEVTMADYRATFDVNFAGAFLCFKHAIPALRRAGGGAMSVTTSIVAHTGMPQLDMYTASKGALIALVRSLAADLWPLIRVNAVSPGSLHTRMAQHAAEARGDKPPEPAVHPQDDPDTLRADPRAAAYPHLFLVSDEASFVTGQTLLADGGWSLTPPPH
jgi:NAD(P)-dependent dehydrogenase (short-subunit alcohol dehydrogenase family)